MESNTYRRFKGDKWSRSLGSRIPIGTIVRVIKFLPRRRVIVEYNREPILTMLWCLEKIESCHDLWDLKTGR